jgi:hypothetical protein
MLSQHNKEQSQKNEQHQEPPPSSITNAIAELQDSLVHTAANTFRSRKQSCDWESYEDQFINLILLVNSNQIEMGLQSAILPFDSLSLPVSMKWRRGIAEKHAEQYEARVFAPPLQVCVVLNDLSLVSFHFLLLIDCL